MSLKIHNPDKYLARDAEEADRILAKIHEEGKLASLLANERHSNDTVVFKERKEIASE